MFSLFFAQWPLLPLVSCVCVCVCYSIDCLVTCDRRAFWIHLEMGSCQCAKGRWSLEILAFILTDQ